MSLMQPPQSPSKQKPTLRTRLAAEWDHFEQMPYSRLFLLLVPSILLLIIDPLVPIAAYLLQMWAGSSHTWRERWASLIAGAKRCAIILALLALYLLLNHAQVWIIPTLTYDLQRLWQTYLPGILSLSLVNGQSLLARSLLLLPLAPILAVYDERIDPRTGRPLNRVLKADDLKPPKRKTSSIATPTSATPNPPTPPPNPTTSHKTPPKKTTQKAAASEQVTIESFLASQPTEEKTSGSSASAPSDTTKTSPPPSPAQQPEERKKINWDTLLE